MTLAEQAIRVFAHAPAGRVLHLRAGAGPWRDALLGILSTLVRTARCPARPTPDALAGGVDLAATLAAGRTVLNPGLLARAPVLLVASAELLDPAAAALLAGAAGRPGIVLLDEGEGDEQPPSVVLDDASILVNESWGSAPGPAGAFGPGPLDCAAFLAAASLQLGVGSLRALVAAFGVARSAAALAGRADPDGDDLALAVALSLAPRATRVPELDTPPPEPGPGDPPSTRDTPDRIADDPERVLDAVLAALPPGLIPADGRGRTPGRGAGRAPRPGAGGRPLPPRRSRPRAGTRLALVATIRAAAPHQVARRAAALPGDTRRLHVRGRDLHTARAARRPGAVALFVVDTSGSAARARLAEAKGAIERLLGECYVRRDRVALLAVRGREPALVLPPTGSLARARRLLAAMPSGGGTPLAAGLDLAQTLAAELRRRGENPVVVLLTDGDANIARDGTPDRARAAADARASAERLAAFRIPAFVVDLAPRPGRRAAALAAWLGARTVPLASAPTLAVTIRAATA